jgi:hypothetical protein
LSVSRYSKRTGRCWLLAHSRKRARSVFPIVAAMAAYGDRWLVGDEGTPLILHHTDCDRDMHAVVTCSECAEPLTVRKVKGRRGPGYSAAGA